MYYVLIRFVTRLTRWVPLVEQELLTLPEHPSSPPVFSVVRVARSLAWCVCFVDCCLSVCAFSFGHCVVCSSSIYGFWLPLWYLQTLLILMKFSNTVLISEQRSKDAKRQFVYFRLHQTYPKPELDRSLYPSGCGMRANPLSISFVKSHKNVIRTTYIFIF